MTTSFIGALLLASLLTSTGTTGTAATTKDTINMEKENIGSLVALYPKPLTVVGAEVNGKVN